MTRKITSLEPIRDRILVKNMNFKERFSQGGIMLPGDDRTSSGIRPRWAEVIAVGPEQNDIKVGEWVLVAHGRWTRGVKFDVNGEEMIVQMIDNNDILLVSDEPRVDETMSNAVSG